MAGKTGRRGHNEGAIYQRADGRWVGAVHLGWEGGKRRRKVVYGKTRAEVNQKVTRILAEQQKGLPIQTASTTVAVFLEQWMHDVVIPNRTPGTARHYRSMIDAHLKDTIGRHTLEKLTQRHVQAMLNAKQAAGASPAHVRQIRSVLRAALNQAMRWDLVGRNVAVLTESPKVERFEGQALDPVQVRALMAAVEGHELEALFAIATSVGLRMGELLGLRWVDVDIEAGTLQVRKQLQVIGGRPILVDLKSRSSRRTVTLADGVAAIVRRHRTRQIAAQLEAGTPWTEAGHVFARPSGAPLSDEYVRHQWYRVREAAGLPEGMRFHDLRHTALTILATRGTDPRTLMGIAGHATIATTMQVYAHLVPSAMRSSADLLDDLYSVEMGAS